MPLTFGQTVQNLGCQIADVDRFPQHCADVVSLHDEVQEVPGIGAGLVDDLRRGGAKVKGVLERTVETILGKR